MIPSYCSYIYYCNPFPIFTFLNAITASQLSNVVSPKFYEGPGTFVPVTRVDLMNVDQTENWVRTFANHRGWENGDDYAKSFKEEKINGLELQYLTHNILEGLGIKSLEHRQEILSTTLYLYNGFPMACDYLSSDARSSAREFENKISASESDRSDGRSFASSTHIDGIDQYFESESVSCINSTSPGYSCSTFSSPVYSPMSTRSNCGRECEKNGLSMLVTADSKSYTFVEKRKPRMYQMSKYRGSHENNVGFLHMTPVMSRKLLVTISPEQDYNQEISKTRIRTRFQELNISVEDVKEFEIKQHVYVVEFSDKKKALDALLRSEEIGYQIRWKWPKQPGTTKCKNV